MSTWFFILILSGTPMQFGPFQSQVECFDTVSWFYRVGRVTEMAPLSSAYVSHCWEVKR